METVTESSGSVRLGLMHHRRNEESRKQRRKWKCLTSAVLSDLLDHQLVVDVGRDGVVLDGDVAAVEHCVEPLHSEVTRPVVVGILVVAEDQQNVLPPPERVLDPGAELAQLLVGGARVGDCGIALESNGASSGCYHGNLPVGGEAGDGRGGVVAAGPNEGPRVMGQLEVDGDQRCHGVRAEAVTVLRAAVNQLEL